MCDKNGAVVTDLTGTDQSLIREDDRDDDDDGGDGGALVVVVVVMIVVAVGFPQIFQEMPRYYLKLVHDC